MSDRARDRLQRVRKIAALKGSRDSMTPRPVRFDDLPLFASERELAIALLGPERFSAWKGLAPLYERRGLQKIDPCMGGRYTPAVKAFFDFEYGLGPKAPAAPPGVEKVIEFGPRRKPKSPNADQKGPR